MIIQWVSSLFFYDLSFIFMYFINMITIATFYYPVPTAVIHERNLGYQNTA